MAYTSSNASNDWIKVSTVTIMSCCAISGRTIEVIIRIPLTPSRREASIISVGMDWRPARKISSDNPTPNQQLTKIMETSAVLGSPSHVMASDSSPTFCSITFKVP
ncbi:hypothetical protein D3C72_2131700 [compost metagenome]